MKLNYASGNIVQLSAFFGGSWFKCAVSGQKRWITLPVLKAEAVPRAADRDVRVHDYLLFSQEWKA